METVWKKQMKVGGQGAQPMKCITETHTTQEEVKHTHTHKNKTGVFGHTGRSGSYLMVGHHFGENGGQHKNANVD